MANLAWELDDLLKIKKNHERSADIAFRKAADELEKERKKLEHVKKILEDAKKNVETEKQVLFKTFKSVTTPSKVESRKHYIKYLIFIVSVKKKDVDAQERNVEKYVKIKDDAKQVLLEKSKEVNKLEEFRKVWEKDMKKKRLEEEEKIIDETGELMFQTRKFNNEG